jgi:hypothetical protein
MRSNPWSGAALAVLLFPAIAAAQTAVPSQDPSLAAPSVSLTTSALVAREPGAAPTLALSTPLVGGIGYRPRYYRSHTQVMPLTTEVHVGFFDPTDNFSTGFEAGVRAGPQVDPHVQIGLGLDWWHKSESSTTDLGAITVPGGSGSERLLLARSTANLVPIMAFVQVSGDENMPVIPYGGFGAGYEWLFLTADDFLTGNSFDQTFGGWGWQLWGGAGIPLGSGTRLNGEVFYNGSEVGSDVDVMIADFGPATVRDVVKVNGVGMRFGISWGF